MATSISIGCSGYGPVAGSPGRISKEAATLGSEHGRATLSRRQRELLGCSRGPSLADPSYMFGMPLG